MGPALSYGYTSTGAAYAPSMSFTQGSAQAYRAARAAHEPQILPAYAPISAPAPAYEQRPHSQYAPEPVLAPRSVAMEPSQALAALTGNLAPSPEPYQASFQALSRRTAPTEAPRLVAMTHNGLVLAYAPEPATSGFSAPSAAPITYGPASAMTPLAYAGRMQGALGCRYPC